MAKYTIWADPDGCCEGAEGALVACIPDEFLQEIQNSFTVAEFLEVLADHMDGICGDCVRFKQIEDNFTYHVLVTDKRTDGVGWYYNQGRFYYKRGDGV